MMPPDLSFRPLSRNPVFKLRGLLPRPRQGVTPRLLCGRHFQMPFSPLYPFGRGVRGEGYTISPPIQCCFLPPPPYKRVRLTPASRTSHPMHVHNWRIFSAELSLGYLLSRAQGIDYFQPRRSHRRKESADNSHYQCEHEGRNNNA